MFASTKSFLPGYSVAFRQWKADSHCKYLHGYALQFFLVFEADELDAVNWVVDFGGLGEVEAWLKKNFDHKTVVASDDPLLEDLYELEHRGALELVEMNDVGCEKFAEYTADFVMRFLANKYDTRVRLRSVEVREHARNSAIYEPQYDRKG